MTGRVAVVTDSGACLPAALARGLGVVSVPLHVSVGDDEYLDSEQIVPGDVATALRGRARVTTSRPSPEELLEAYRRLAADGAREVVSVHISGALSGTCDAAVLAARDAPVPVHVVDSRSLGMGLGFAVLAAARCADDGGDGAAAAGAARDRAAAVHVLFSMDTLEHLRRGGRIGAAQAFLGSALAVKPLLHLVDGRVEPFEKVRTASRALARLEELAVTRAGGADVDLAVHHLDALERARGLAERLAARVPRAVDLHVVEVSGAVGAHVGPGLLGVVVSPRAEQGAAHGEAAR